MKPNRPPLDPVPVDDYVSALWRAVLAGAITWDELRELQARYLSTKEPVPIPPAVPAATARRS